MNRAEAAAIGRAAMAAKRPGLHERYWSKVDVQGNDDCWPWLAAKRNRSHGYGAFWFEGRHQPSNRIALILSGTPVPTGMFACHSCDNPSCCNPRHLFVGTNKDNNDDKVAKGRHVFGERYWNAKLTAEQVAIIRAHKNPGMKRLPAGIPAMLAERFSVSRQYISEVLNNGWRNA